MKSPKSYGTTLEKLLQGQGFGSRRECRELARSGAVRVRGALCVDPGAEVRWAADEALRFEVAGVEWCYRDRVYLAMHKPRGYECSARPTHHPSVLELLPRPFVLRGVQCVGRLDVETTGLLLLSDDGAFIQAQTSPRRHVPKRYEAVLAEEATAELAERLVTGVRLSDAPAPVAALGCVAPGPRALRLVVDEGRYHQVRRMVAAAGNSVVALARTAIGGYALPADLPAGGFVELGDAERARALSVPEALGDLLRGASSD